MKIAIEGVGLEQRLELSDAGVAVTLEVAERKSNVSVGAYRLWPHIRLSIRAPVRETIRPSRSRSRSCEDRVTLPRVLRIGQPRPAHVLLRQLLQGRRAPARAPSA